MPKTVLPDGSSKYDGGGYSLTIKSDGSIQVKPGDWLSKYSLAIYGNINHINEFYRKEGSLLKEIINKDLIQAGETLYHEPSIPKDTKPITPPPDLDVDKIIRESGLPPSARDPIAWLINTPRAGTSVVSLVGVFVDLGVLGGLNAIGGTLLGILGSCYALWQARNFGIKQTGLRGTTYGAVAWAFNHGKPTLPSAIEKSLRNSPVADIEAEIQRYKQTWLRAVTASQNKLDAYCQKKNLVKQEVQIALQAWSLSYGGQSPTPMPEWLAAGMLLDTAEQYYSRKVDRFTFLQPWSWYPNDKYIGRPNYPPKINQRYPWS